MEYKVIRSRELVGFISTINSLLACGWELIGSHQVVIKKINDQDNEIWSQTMIHKK